ncbi:GNAT family N-acetyltransferase [Maritalea sp.]|uniref:GNAT family N-acetyltransferase n=1 Tax=Maritalea sp. TaxID=2003361 RepID=UPI003EF9B3A6
MAEVELRFVEAQDFEDVCRFHIDPRTNIFHPSPPNGSQFSVVFDGWLHDKVRFGYCYFTALDGGKPVGVGGITQKLDLAGNPYNNLYFRIDADFHGKGIATKLGRAGLALAEQDDLPLIAMAAPENAPSVHMIKKLSLIPLDGHRLQDDGSLVFHLLK